MRTAYLFHGCAKMHHVMNKTFSLSRYSGKERDKAVFLLTLVFSVKLSHKPVAGVDFSSP